MTSRIAEIINRYPPLAFTSHPALIAELEAYHAGLVGALEEAHSALGPTVRIHTAAARAEVARLKAELAETRTSAAEWKQFDLFPERMRLLYAIRKTLGWNEKTALDSIPGGIRTIIAERDMFRVALEALVASAHRRNQHGHIPVGWYESIAEAEKVLKMGGWSKDD